MEQQPSTRRKLDQLGRAIEEAMLRDRGPLRQRLRRLREAARKQDADFSGNGAGAALERLEQDVEQSRERVRVRAQRTVKVSYPPELPVSGKRDEIAAALQQHQVIVVCGETGSGKTTQLPKICLDLGRGITGMIGHTQPRRIAARRVAARIADELSEPLGGTVGFKTRFSDRVGPECRVKVMTDGIMLAEIRSDRLLRQYDTIIIDEAHERSLNIDFLLGYLRHMLPKRPELKVIITSATIDPQRFSEHFRDAPIIEVSGRTYPVEVRYRPLARDEADGDDRDLTSALLEAVDELSAEGPGDILVFLPGEREIREAAKALRSRRSNAIDVLPLYARLATAEQNRVFEPHSRRRVVLATNVAETSLTVPGVRSVIDTGVARMSRYSSRRKVQLLPIEPISRASADQRMGRCGRTSGGICIRLYSQEEYERRERFTEPEILRTNLANVILQMHALDLGEIESFPFIEPPRRGTIRDGYKTLHELGALDDDDRLTKIGERLAHLPLDPRLGRMLIEAEREHCLREMLILTSALSVPDVFERPAEAAEKADAAHEIFRDKQSDFVTLLNLWKFFHERKESCSWNQMKAICRQHYISFVRMREWLDVHRQLRDLMREQSAKANTRGAPYDAVHRALLSGLLSNVARRSDGHKYEGTGGKEVMIFPGSSLFSEAPQWIVAAELVETAKLYGRTVARVQPQWIERLAEHLVKRSYSDPHWRKRSGQVMAKEKVTLFGLELAADRRVHFGPIDPDLSRQLFIQAGLVEATIETKGAFFDYNLALIAEIEQMQAKRRRRDLLATAAAQYVFYDHRIPEGIYSTKRFESWRRKAERRDPRMLHMTADDLLLHTEVHATLGDYPATLFAVGRECALSYCFEPGRPDDGVTITVPAELVHHLDGQQLEWLVPGYLEEKIEALIRGLPKMLRRGLTPANVFAQNLACRITFGEGSLLIACSAALRAMNGAEIPIDAWQPNELPPHLRMNIRATDRQGRIVSEGRDLAELQMRVSGEAAGVLQQSIEHPLIRRGITAWDFDVLPEHVPLTSGGYSITVFPTLIDERKSVAIDLVQTHARAERMLRSGVRRLLQLHLAEELRFQIDALPGVEEMRLLSKAVRSVGDINDALALLTVEAAFLQALHALPRTMKEFLRLIDTGYPNLWSAGLRVGGITREILQSAQQVSLALSEPMPAQWQAVTADIDAQLEHLMPQGFLLEVPVDRLAHLPRYLQGITARLRKLTGGGFARDQRAAEELLPYWSRYLHAAKTQVDAEAGHEELDRYRWLVEEARIMVFAQELRSAEPISFKRLDQQWARAEGR